MPLRTKILWVIVPVLVTLNQICMRTIAFESRDVAFSWKWVELVILNPWLLAAVALEIISFIAWLKILSTHNLSVAFPISSISYVLILAVGNLAFHETLQPLQILGSALIIGGCWLIGTASKQDKII